MYCEEKMYCENCGAEVAGRFCPNCGAEAHGQSQSKQNVIVGRKENLYILTRSISCTKLIEDGKKFVEKRINGAYIMLVIPAIIAFFWPIVVAWLEDKKVDPDDMMPLPVLLLVTMIVVCSTIAMVKVFNAVNKRYSEQKHYCSQEFLIVDEVKIYGSTLAEKIELKYDQIESVRCHPSGRQSIVSNDIFTVTDVTGRIFMFYTFENCHELKTTIDMQIRKSNGERA